MTKKQSPRTPQQQAMIDKIPVLQLVESWPGYWKEVADARKIECDELRQDLTDMSALCCEQTCLRGESERARDELRLRLEEARKTMKVTRSGLKSIQQGCLSVMDAQGVLHAEMLMKSLATALRGKEE